MNLDIYKNTKITLTDKGAEMLNKYYNMRPMNHGETDSKKKIYKAGEVYENTLMEIMNIFGKYLYEGCTPLFKDNIIEY